MEGGEEEGRSRLKRRREWSVKWMHGKVCVERVRDAALGLAKARSSQWGIRREKRRREEG